MITLNALWTWLMTPLSGSAVHEISSAVSWHARLMVLAWAVLLPIGVLIARFYKVTPQQDWPKVLDNKRWWHGHLSTQLLGTVAAVLGVYLIVTAQKPSIQTAVLKNADLLTLLHHYLGYFVLSLALLQVLGGFLRGSKGGPSDTQMRGDHYDMTTRRKLFEAAHKGAGYAALLLAVITIMLGLVISDAPRWMVIILTAWWLALTFAFISLQRSGRCIDTYQAIWGDDMSHPGNAMPSAGWGSQRYCASTSVHRQPPKPIQSILANKDQS